MAEAADGQLTSREVLRRKEMTGTKNCKQGQRRIVIATLLSCLLSASVVLTACGNAGDGAGGEDHFGYAVDEYLITTNAASAVGASSDAQLVTGRLYPGVYVNGPKGQRIPNTDLVEVRALPGAKSKVEYRITDKAVYSDGQPVTCDSFLLAYVAGTKRPLFDSYNPLMEQIEKVECQPGSKIATVVFREGFGERWRYLFGGGMLLPAHALANKLGISLDQFNIALHNGEQEELQPIADLWNTGFELGKFDPALQVSSGPYVVESVGSSGEVTLSRNDKYYGEAPALDKIIMWPKGADLTALAAEKRIHVAEVPAVNSTTWVDRDDSKNPYEITPTAGVLTEHLILGNAGVFASPERRAAFAACVDQAAVAEASSRVSGVKVQPTTVRTARMSDPVVQHLNYITDPRMAVDIPAAEVLRGETIRIGYFAPDERKAAMVKAIAQSCQPAGITITDVSAEAAIVSMLPQTYGDPVKGEIIVDGPVDAILQTIDPQYFFSEAATLTSNIDAARGAEQYSWDVVRTIPLAQQPRVYVYGKDVANIVDNTDLYGIGWNMDRWQEN